MIIKTEDALQQTNQRGKQDSSIIVSLLSVQKIKKNITHTSYCQ